MNKTVLVIGIIFLLVGISINPADAVLNSNDDITPPVSTHSLDTSGPDGLNGYYVSDVYITVNATDDISGVKEIRYRINNGAEYVIAGDNGTFIIHYDGNNIPVKYWAIDNAGNEETPNIFYIDMDQTKPKMTIITELVEGNIIEGWLFRYTVTATDDTSGMERVEFFLNDDLQLTAYGSGPLYEWYYRYYGNLSVDIIAYAYDRAGNFDFEEADWRSRDIIIKQSIHLLFQLFLESFPLLNKILCSIQGR
jgi:hypothetical protein